MSFESIASMGSSAMGGGDGGILSILMKALQAGKSINDLVGPKGALVTGNIPQGMAAGQNLMSGYDSFFGTPKYGPDNLPTTTPTTQSTMNMSRDAFMALDPAVREKMLRRLAEETNVFGSIR
jgi:hypothetical protein